MEFQSENGRFFANDADGRLIAEVTYTPIADEDAIALDHTFVDPSLRGQGVAAQLVEQVVALARQKGLKIEPVCSYAKHAFQVTPEYEDVRR